MGGGDRCAVFECDNDRRYPESLVTKDHVTTLKWHSTSNEKYQKEWTKLLNRPGLTVNNSTTVCSNHFKYGQPFRIDPHPTLYLKGYNLERQSTPRRPPRQRTNIVSTPRRPRKKKEPSHKSIGVQVEPSDFVVPSEHDHDYETPYPDQPRYASESYVSTLERELENLRINYEKLQDEIKGANDLIGELKANVQAKKMTIGDIAQSDELIKLYTGIPSYALFRWLFAEIEPHAQNLHYFKGKASTSDKNYQINNTNKPGPKRAQSLENEMLMTLMKVRLNLREEDLAFRFGIGQSTVSQVISTWLPFLHKELEAFINWPSKEATLKYYPMGFRKYKGTVRCIIDCTEIQVERPSLASCNIQIYSQYKSRPTLKCLVGVTPSGAISYLSAPVGGNTSDKQLVKMSGIVDNFEPGDICMADRGFNIQELFLHKQVRLVIPPFMRTTKSTSQFTESEDTKTKTVANSRIHVERAIGRLKEFSILQGPIPLTMIDIMESALVVCAAIANLQPVLVPLTS